ncbi:DUF2530 domain-containing protein [Streptomyces sp. ST2-7A]|uniref:DUF2530 domain-containing protein n=1 Tax=Streptomyces sp. ST2-7A TaxID=2907214 RepID=UPI001F37D4ED|nr:DUF2530 domain-containing protein [Streptomyces sp. ST2-7A]MCE7079070.1 DUF2530 domain-containing protein [Streptomyces sp. ST2-7A]
MGIRRDFQRRRDGRATTMPRDFLTHGKRKAPEPLEGNIPVVVMALTSVWGILLVGSLPFHSRLADHDAEWWIGSCGAGVLLGLYGLWFVRRRETAALRRAADATTPARGNGGVGPTETGTTSPENHPDDDAHPQHRD